MTAASAEKPRKCARRCRRRSPTRPTQRGTRRPTEWQKGKYTRCTQRPEKMRYGVNIMRSANAPVISAGAITANMPWNTAYVSRKGDGASSFGGRSAYRDGDASAPDVLEKKKKANRRKKTRVTDGGAQASSPRVPCMCGRNRRELWGNGGGDARTVRAAEEANEKSRTRSLAARVFALRCCFGAARARAAFSSREFRAVGKTHVRRRGRGWSHQHPRCWRAWRRRMGRRIACPICRSTGRSPRRPR